MPYMPAPNKPFELTTEHGRAQAHAHSEYGDMLASTVEHALQEQTDEVCDRVEALVEKEIEQLNKVDVEDQTLTQNLWLFHSELGVRDKNAFAKLVQAYETERAQLVGNIALLTRLIDEIKVQVGIDDEEDTE